jgi:voltage-gated potassium channel
MMETYRKMENRSVLDKPIYAWVLASLIIYSVICFSIETLPNLSDTTTQFLNYSETIVVSIFTMEFIYRIITSDKKLKFIFSFYGMIDLIAILPFYLAFSIDLRAFRLIRFLRLIRILKLARYNLAIQRFNQALYVAKEELVIFTLATTVMLYLAAVGIYHFEHHAQPEVFRSIFDSLWWAVATLTTVGYGDIYPITTGGKAFTFIILMLGLGLVTVPTGILSSALAATRRQEDTDKKQLSKSP